MKRRTLGTPGLGVSETGLGCMGMSEFYGPSSEVESITTIHRALELGLNFLDTADLQTVREREQVGRRSGIAEVVLATKFGNVRNAQGQSLGIAATPSMCARPVMHR
jgi:aryl-alcohol dehydrogenase-like predicted oxidoreductase